MHMCWNVNQNAQYGSVYVEGGCPTFLPRAIAHFLSRANAQREIHRFTQHFQKLPGQFSDPSFMTQVD